MASWAEDVNRHAAAKTTLQFEQPQVERFTRQRGRDWQLDASGKIDPILQYPKSPEKRAEMSKAESTAMIRSINRGMQRELDNSEVGYDIVTCQPKFGLTEAQVKEAFAHVTQKRGRRAVSPHQSTPYNVLNLSETQGAVPKERRHKIPPLNTSLHTRDFNVVSGQYYRDHEVRKLQQEDALRQRVTERFVETHDYHPILGRFYDQDKEEALQRTEDWQKETKKCELHSVDAPPGVRGTEGHSYDIINGTVHHPYQVQRIIDLENRGVPSRVDFRYHQGEYCDELDSTVERDRERSINRKRHPGTLSAHVTHGFDIVTGQLFTQHMSLTEPGAMKASPKTHRVPPVPLSVLRQETVADRLQRIEAHTATSRSRLENSRSELPPYPMTSHEKVFPVPIPRFPKADKAAISSVADFVHRRTGTAPLPAVGT